MDLKFNELINYLLKELEGHENAIKIARQRRYAGYKQTIQSRKVDIIKLKNILRKAEEISGEKILPDEVTDNTLYWDELKYDDLRQLVNKGMSDEELATMFEVTPKTIEKKRLQWNIRRDR